MSIPKEAYVFEEEMDPGDINDFIARCATSVDGKPPLLEVGESITGFTIDLNAEAEAVGVEVGTAAYAAEKINADKDVRFWLRVADDQQSNTKFGGSGFKAALALTINTNTAPPRKLQRTLVVRIKQR